MTQQILRHNGRRIPANVRPYVEALGVDDAVRFLLKFGGSEIYLPSGEPCKRNGEDSMAVRLIGAEKVMALSEQLGGGYFKVPLANRWIGETLYMNGRKCAEIARMVRADVSTVSRWINARPAKNV